MMRESKLVQQIRREAQLEALHSSLDIVLRGSFGDEVAEELKPLVEAISDLKQLEKLIAKASSGDLAALRAAVRSRV